MSSNNNFGITFDLPKNQSNVIKVIGVGGGGSNAINHMFKQGIKGVDFVICNTDSQALNNSGVPNKIQLGVNLTEGLGAGANPEIGEQSAVESLEDIRTMLTTNTKMVFITAGMGGGTGTGAAPIIAKMAKEMDILTVGIVTMPFEFEGKIRNAQAHQGIEKFRKTVDSLVIINNNKLRDVYGNLGFKAGFSKADEVLSTAARGIAEVITHHYLQNIDLRDAKTVLSNSGTAIMGSSTSAGQNRAQEAITNALDSPLLNDNKITGAKNVLLLIVSGAQEITIDEIGEINDHIQAEAGYGANIIMGVGEDESLGEAISVTIIATGFDVDQQNDITNTEVKKVVHALEDEQTMQHDLMPLDPLETPSATAEIVSEDTVVYNLDEVDSEVVTEIFSESELIPTSDSIKNIEVVYEEVHIDDNEDEFVINEVTTMSTEEVDFEAVQEDQTMLTFDLPISNKLLKSESEEVEVFTLEDTVNEIEVNDIKVNDYIELIPVTEANETGETRYVLDDHIVLEQTDQKYQDKKQSNEVEVDEEMTFTKVTVKERTVTSEPEETTNPYDSPISITLRERADERRQKMKAFNYKFNTSKIEEIEKEPAYKRQGVNLNDVAHSSDVQSSRTTIGLDDNDEVQLRSNNSYLHDNVD
ncbi:MAG: cell division protein FtsZ [Flavobacteriaceae bacterium]|jgi:cell division protein FtsZ|nr:cell division protein FtsZ [Flavobacteriaceae bacterium]MDA7849253.1 cell division protein FtsZ [Flavobacteriaceae bacterium]MDG1309134.1 cell division protein FtsZ [Flavobacteriaceae bacterium]|tara:strand:- start:597 stop:2525 length:1929 start_codon:yes stop_codon:yes gene_type:complete